MIELEPIEQCDEDAALEKMAVARGIIKWMPAVRGSRRLFADDVAMLLFLSVRGPCRVGHIADHLGVGQALSSEITIRLEKDGYVERCRDHVDHRRTWVRLTPKGAQLLRMNRSGNKRWLR